MTGCEVKDLSTTIGNAAAASAETIVPVQTEGNRKAKFVCLRGGYIAKFRSTVAN